jgi:hypothetical protein
MLKLGFDQHWTQRRCRPHVLVSYSADSAQLTKNRVRLGGVRVRVIFGVLRQSVASSSAWASALFSVRSLRALDISRDGFDARKPGTRLYVPYANN